MERASDQQGQFHAAIDDNPGEPLKKNFTAADTHEYHPSPDNELGVHALSAVLLENQPSALQLTCPHELVYRSSPRYRHSHASSTAAPAQDH